MGNVSKVAIGIAVSGASLIALSDAGMAWSRTRHRDYPAWPPTIRLYRSNPGTNYYNVCGVRGLCLLAQPRSGIGQRSLVGPLPSLCRLKCYAERPRCGAGAYAYACHSLQ